MITDEDREIVLAFLQESTENLDQLDRDLVDLETTPDDPELLARVFRTIHTIKGTCGFLGFGELEALTHAGETLLGALRGGELALDAAIATSLLRLVDAVRAILRTIDSDGDEGDTDHTALVEELTAHVRASSPPVAAVPVTIPATPTDDVAQTHSAELGHATVSSVPPHPAAAVVAGAGAGESSVRVDVAVLDKLMDLVGELVLTRSQIGDLASQDEDGALTGPYRALRLLTNELQEGVMRARLQPVGTVTGKFRRIARDIAAGLDKHVTVELEGEDVGVDKAINEALRDPLLHLVRNAIDHGLETSLERVAAGKPATGTLRIKTYHERGRIHVDVSDDGRGIDPVRLVTKAVAAGLVSAAEGDRMPKSEALDLVFRPGLSTKDTVTNLSGRGVGMDVVRSNLQQIGGSIELSSIAGVGTVVRINVPLTLAIMPTLVVTSGGERYAVPQVNVREIVHVEEADTANRIYDVDGALVCRLRDLLLPVVDLGHQLAASVAPAAAGDERHGLDLVVVECDDRRFALAVDAIGDTVDAVVKPLPRATLAITTFAGVTILSDGRATLILDVAGLANRSGLTAGSPVLYDEPPSRARALDAAELLTAHADDTDRVAVRLGSVRRLERVAADEIERLGRHDVIRYGDGVLPLIRVIRFMHHALPWRESPSDAPGDLLDVIVCGSSAGEVGLVVDHIDDVVAEPPRSDDGAHDRNGVADCVVIDGEVTEVMDVEALVTASGIGGAA